MYTPKIKNAMVKYNGVKKLKLNLRQYSVARLENNGQVQYRFLQEDLLKPQPHRQVNPPADQIK
jgi:hypothetical protein